MTHLSFFKKGSQSSCLAHSCITSNWSSAWLGETGLRNILRSKEPTEMQGKIDGFQSTESPKGLKQRKYITLQPFSIQRPGWSVRDRGSSGTTVVTLKDALRQGHGCTPDLDAPRTSLHVVTFPPVTHAASTQHWQI